MIRIEKLFPDAETNVFYRYFSMIVIMFVYNTMAYYYVAKDKMEKPDVAYLLIAAAFHVVQAIVVKYFYSTKDFVYAWAVILVPAALLVAYMKQKEKENFEKEKYLKFLKKYKEMQASLQQPEQRGQFQEGRMIPIEDRPGPKEQLNQREMVGNTIVHKNPSTNPPMQTPMPQMNMGQSYGIQEKMMRPQMMQANPMIQQRAATDVIDMIPQTGMIEGGMGADFAPEPMGMSAFGSFGSF